MVEQEEHDTIGVRLLEDFYCLVDLREELVMIPPFVAVRAQICNASCIFHHDAFLIADNKASIVFLDEIRDMNESPLPFLYQLLPSIFIIPFQVSVEIMPLGDQQQVRTKLFVCIYWHENNSHLEKQQ